MLQDLLWADSLPRLHTQDLHEQIHEIFVVDPRLARPIESFLQHVQQTLEAAAHQLVLLGENLCIIAPRHAEEPQVNDAAAILREHPTLQAQPQGEPAQHLNQDTAEGPHVEDKRDFGKVLNAYVRLLRKTLR